MIEPIDPAKVAARLRRNAMHRYNKHARHYRHLIAAGRTLDAANYAARNNFTPPDPAAELPPEPDSSLELTGMKLEPAPAAPETPESTRPQIPEVAPTRAEMNGWPVETTATIVNTCRNRRLLQIQLADGRSASLWSTGRRFRLGQVLHVHLDEDEARSDPRYLPGALI